MPNIFFTADEHYGHTNIIRYCQRPFRDVNEMDNELIKRHNEVVGVDDIVYHLGDFTILKNKEKAEKYIKRLNGYHFFIKGSHDYWLKDRQDIDKILELEIDGFPLIVLCHYAMRVWSRSHYNSWQLYGHSHGKLAGCGKQMDVGVDTNNFYPYSLKEIKQLIDKKEDNFNLVCLNKDSQRNLLK